MKVFLQATYLCLKSSQNYLLNDLAFFSQQYCILALPLMSFLMVWPSSPSNLLKYLGNKLKKSEDDKKNADSRMKSLMLLLEEMNTNHEKELQTQSEEILDHQKKMNLLVTEQHQLNDNLDEKVAKLNEFEKQRSANVFQSTQTS